MKAASARIPTPLIPQLMMASGPAPAAMFCGRLNTPEPIIEPMTTAVSAPSPSFCDSTGTVFVLLLPTMRAVIALPSSNVVVRESENVIIIVTNTVTEVCNGFFDLS
jgi:hypothetical protein